MLVADSRHRDRRCLVSTFQACSLPRGEHVLDKPSQWGRRGHQIGHFICPSSPQVCKLLFKITRGLLTFLLKKEPCEQKCDFFFFLAKMYCFPLRVRNRKVLHCLSRLWLKQVGTFSLHQSNIFLYKPSYVMSLFKLHIHIWVCLKVLPFCWHSPVCFSMGHIFSFVIYLWRNSWKKEKTVKC